MEIYIFLAVWGGLLFVIYKFAKSKNREAIGYVVAGLIVSPIIILIILAFLQKLSAPKKRRTQKKRRTKKLK